MKKIYGLLLAFAFTFSGCEKDDICVAETPTTPRLVIEFYDVNEPTVLKNITNLALEPDETGLNTLVFNGVSKILVPLKTTEDSTKFNFTLNFENPNPVLVYTDILEFNYSRNTVYVSRACGFKTLFNLNNDIALADPYILNNNPALTVGVWIKNIIVEKYNLETENETHIKIYF